MTRPTDWMTSKDSDQHWHPSSLVSSTLYYETKFCDHKRDGSKWNDTLDVLILCWVHSRHTVKFLNFWTPENIAVIYLKFKQ